MILLIWDTCGEEELKLYEFADDSLEASLAKECDGHMINEVGLSQIVEDNLVELSNALPKKSSLHSGPFGPYSAIYISGFVP